MLDKVLLWRCCLTSLFGYKVFSKMSLGLISVNDCAVNMLLRNEKMLKLAMMKTLTMLKVYMTGRKFVMAC